MSLAQAEFDQLIAEVRQGSEDALAELFRRFNPLVYNTIRKHMPIQMRNTFDSADVAQIAWGTLFHHPTRLCQRESPSAMKSYVATVVLNKLRMELRKHKTQKSGRHRDEVSLENIEEPVISPDPTPSRVAMGREEWLHVLKRWPPHYREIMRLVAQGYRSREIAEQLGTDEGNVRRIRRRVVKELRNGNQTDS
jgi:RNA polymerase sigma factor (sigma-70 family)